MLELRPDCEHCGRDLPPASTEARICSFECTFCANCVDGPLQGVCPNCGGDFVPRPIRPARDHRAGNCLANHPADERRRHRPVDLRAHAELLARVAVLDPEAR